MKSYPLIWILLVVSVLKMVKLEDDDCLYTFENESEMEDFDSNCDGKKGEWEIAELPDGAPSSFGKKALTIKAEIQGCLKSSKKLTLNSTTKVLTKFYWQKPQFGSVSFKIQFLSNNLYCQNEINCQKDFTKASCENNNDCIWDIGLKYDNVVGEKWVEEEFNVFKLPETQDYKMQIELYLNSAKVMIDSITVADIISNSDQCYVNPRTTTTTTELTTTTTSEITTATTELVTSTSTAAETTTEISTTTLEDTTSEKSTPTITITAIESTTTTIEPTTITQTKTTEEAETTTDATTTTNDIITTEQTTSTSDRVSTISNETPTTTSTVGSSVSTSESAESPAVSTLPSTVSTYPDNESNGLPYIFLIAFLVMISILAILFFCSFIIWFRRRRRRICKGEKMDFTISSQTSISDKMRKTDHEVYNEVEKQWKIVTKSQRR